MEEDDRPRRTVPFTPPPLDAWGVEELRAYIATLRAEIGRAEAAIESRDRHRSAADAFFRPPRAE